MSEEERVVIDLTGIMGYPNQAHKPQLMGLSYPENKPTETGYYLCRHLFESELYDKCIQWSAKRQKWVEILAKHNWNVVEFVPQTRADYYTECMNKTLDIYCKL
jgi:hypothetical protein